MGLGGQFLLVSVLTSVALNSDNLIVAHTFGLAEVAIFAVPAKLLTALGLVVSLLNLPLWPAASDALARGDVEWVRKTVSRMTWLSGAAVAIPSIGLVALGPPLIENWSSVDLSGQRLLLLGLCLWWLMLALASPRFMVQNARGLLRPQLIGWAAFVLLGIPLKLMLAERWGLAALPLTGALAYMLFLGPAVQTGYRRTLKQAQRTLEEQ
jgi:O-antigen/teichoic acid export membrane protein